MSVLHYWGLIDFQVRHANERWIPGVMFSGVGTLLLVVMGVVYLFRPVMYLVDEEGIHVYRAAGVYTMSKESIIRVHRADDYNAFRTIRLFGSGGLFGYTGLFYNSKYGQIRVMASQLKNFIIVYTDRRQPIMITPDNADAFMQACQTVGLIHA
jgi:hypothetical protein